MSDFIKQYPAKPKKVYLYGTCIIDVVAPNSGLDAIALLEREGLEVVYPQGQTCCGQPAFNSGYSDEARNVAKAQMAQFPEPWPIVILSGSCGGMLRKHYPRLLANDPEVEAFSQRVFEFSEFLVHVLNIQLDDLGEQQRVAIHTSCAGRRELGIHDAGVSLLKQLKNIELVDYAYEAECCGFGGTFAVKHSDISTAMVEDKARHLSEANVDCYISSDWGCTLNINGSLEHQNMSLRGDYLASFLWQRTDVNNISHCAVSPSDKRDER
jgi:L-lactate dehydrogenase complex protein LldE